MHAYPQVHTPNCVKTSFYNLLPICMKHEDTMLKHTFKLKLVYKLKQTRERAYKLTCAYKFKRTCKLTCAYKFNLSAQTKPNRQLTS